MLNQLSSTTIYIKNHSHFIYKEKVSALFLWGNGLFRGKLQVDVNIFNFENFESALYMDSVSIITFKISTNKPAIGSVVLKLAPWNVETFCLHLCLGQSK